MESLDIIVLAAGKGTRMRSRLPKVLHTIGGRPMLDHVLQSAKVLGPTRIHVVYGHGGAKVMEVLADPDLNWIEQVEQNGTGHAVVQAMPAVGEGKVLVLFGDVPMIRSQTLADLVGRLDTTSLAILTATVADPSGYGRIVRDPGTCAVTAIVEEKDASAEQRGICEMNTGLLAAHATALRDWVSRLSNRNAQNEYYLTDVVEMAVADGVVVASAQPSSNDEILGVNDRSQLAQLERCYQGRVAHELMLNGVTLADPARVDVRGALTTGEDVTIDVNTVFEGQVTLADGVRVGPNVVIRDAEIGPGTEILANTVIEEAKTGRDCRLGPFARLRPGADLADEVHIGNYVEVKKSTIGTGSKVNHLTYVGDAEVGRAVNVGAGTITCNYDGANKHRTVIGDEAFIGSGVELVAPVTVGVGATIGAGSTIGRDAPAGELTIERSRQKSISGWQRPKKQRS